MTMRSREWMEVITNKWGRVSHSSARRGVLVEDGRDGEPSAEWALRLAIGALQRERDKVAALEGEPYPTRDATVKEDDAALAVLHRSIESEHHCAAGCSCPEGYCERYGITPEEAR